ncbi:MAG: hypothetical protein LAT68_16525 [Cyclobacteriaceae bacterium]|nr:hypothetical protein [Cyclobacteriaceae bacterium]
MVAVTYSPESMEIVEWFYETHASLDPNLRVMNMVKATGLPWAIHVPVVNQYVWATIRNRPQYVRITEVKIGRLTYKVRVTYQYGRNHIGAWRDGIDISRSALFGAKESQSAEEVLRGVGSVFMTRTGTQWEAITLKW